MEKSKIQNPKSKIQTDGFIDPAALMRIKNLDLRAIAPGVYELIALPLRIQGADGSPIRAVLRER